MHEHIIRDLALIVVLGIAAQWLAWQLRLPSILLLLTFGFLAGPVTHLLDPDELFSDLLFPFVSLSVGLILFEGGLTLKFSQIREVHRSVRNLISIGAAITWVLGSAAAYLVLDLGLALSVLLGAILVVTGPTVVIPLLRHVRPVRRVASVARWEGIVIDPVGATLAVLIYEALLIEGWQDATGHALLGLFKTIAVGVAAGGLGAVILVLLLRYYWVPDYLQTSFTLMIVVIVFALSNQLQHESGLLSVTLMGIVLANQKKAGVQHIVVFKETLTVLLISSLFVLLAARVELSELALIDFRSYLFVALMILLVRPISVFAATWGTRLEWEERCFLAWLAPRGIVAAAVASIFSLRLQEAGFEQAGSIVPITFLVIVATVSVYGLTARPLAQKLKLAEATPQGFLILGAHSWCRTLAGRLQSLGFRVALIDRNRHKVRQARLSGLTAWHGNAVREDAEHIDLSGLGRFLAMSANDEANSLACLNFREVFGRAGVYQLVPRAESRSGTARHLRGRLLFGREATFDHLEARFEAGAEIKVTKLTPEFDERAYRELYGSSAIPLFVILSNGLIQLAATDRPITPKRGRTIISLVDP